MEGLDHPSDERLREARERLKRAWALGRPEFQETIHGAERRLTSRKPTVGRFRSAPFRWSWKWGLSAAASVFAVTLAFFTLREGSESERLGALLNEVHEETKLGSWVAPTDFLLDIPGRHLYSRVPTITWPEDWLQAQPRSGSENEEGNDS